MKDLRNTPLRDPPPIEQEVVRTGIAPLDDVLGGGIPKGDGLCLYFVPPVDDWTFIVIMMKAAQEDGKSVFWLGPWEPDTPKWKAHGVDLAKVMIATCSNPSDLMEKSKAVHACGADLLFVEGISTIANIETIGDPFRVWQAQQNAIYNLTHRRRLSNTAVVFSRAVSEKYRNFPVRYASEDDYALFIRDHRPSRFHAELIATQSHFISSEFSCKLPLHIGY